MFVVRCVAGIPPFPLNVVTCFVFHRAHRSRSASAVTVLFVVTCSPPAASVHHPANTACPAHAAAGISPYASPTAFVRTCSSGSPPFPWNTVRCSVTRRYTISHPSAQASDSMLVPSQSPGTTSVNVHPMNASIPTLSTLSGNSTRVNSVHP